MRRRSTQAATAVTDATGTATFQNLTLGGTIVADLVNGDCTREEGSSSIGSRFKEYEVAVSAATKAILVADTAQGFRAIALTRGPNQPSHFLGWTRRHRRAYGSHAQIRCASPANDDRFRGGGRRMSEDMGTFRVDIELENPARPGERRLLRSVLVDTGAELSWVPGEILESLGVQRRSEWHFRQADGTILSRWTGPAFVYTQGRTATDDVVFGEPGDLVLLGARSLEGLNLRVDSRAKRLVDAGPAPVAAAA